MSELDRRRERHLEAMRDGFDDEIKDAVPFAYDALIAQLRTDGEIDLADALVRGIVHLPGTGWGAAFRPKTSLELEP